MQKIARAVIPVNRSCDRAPTQPNEVSERLLATNEGLQAQSKAEETRSTDSAETKLPNHLGTGGLALARTGRCKKAAEDAPFSVSNALDKPANSLDEPTNDPDASTQDQHEPTNDQKEDPKPQPPAVTHIKLHPNLAAAFLKQTCVPVARIWLLLRHLDEKNQGWVSVKDARAQLTNKRSALRICGWRQLRNCLRAGQGTFWERDAERIWLRSVAKVAANLEVKRVVRFVLLPIRVLCRSIQIVRAHFYSILHENLSGGPISRAKLAELSGVNERTQRRYDRRTPIRKQSNYCLEPAAKDPQEAAWRHRHAAFKFIDRQGKYGDKGGSYLAYQLPNSYTTTYQHAAVGRTRKINQQLRQDLVNQRAQGNSRDTLEETQDSDPQSDYVCQRRLFFEDKRKTRKQPNDTYTKLETNGNHSFWTHCA